MRKQLNSLKARLAGFRDDARGSVSVEAALVFPIVMWSMLAMFVFFEGYRQTAINHKAAETIADMYSRETAAIQDTYIDNTKALFDILVDANAESKIRISVVRWDERRDKYRIDWSKVRGGILPELNETDLLAMAANLPTLPDQERIVLVETWSTYTPLFNIGMDDVEMRNFIYTRLRFAPQLQFCNGGCTS